MARLSFDGQSCEGREGERKGRKEREVGRKEREVMYSYVITLLGGGSPSLPKPKALNP